MKSQSNFSLLLNNIHKFLIGSLIVSLLGGIFITQNKVLFIYSAVGLLIGFIWIFLHNTKPQFLLKYQFVILLIPAITVNNATSNTIDAIFPAIIHSLVGVFIYFFTFSLAVFISLKFKLLKLSNK